MAEKHWIGNASAIKQVTTITASGTWGTNDTATVTINGNDLVVTVGTDTATTAIAEIISKAFNAATSTTNLKNDESRNLGGQEIAEFTEITASYAGSTVTFTANTAGKPFTISVSESTASTGSLGSPTTTTNATGPNHWDNADNWSDGSVPVNSDIVIIDSRAKSSVLYGLNQSAVTLASLTITRGFQTPLAIGLPEVNADSSSNKYSEYRDTYLRIGVTALNIGTEGNGVMSGRIKLDLGSVQSTVLVGTTGTTVETGVPPVLIKGTHASNAVYMTSGSIGIGYFEGESAAVATLESAGTVECGDSVTLTNVDVNGGLAIIRSATTTLDVYSGTCIVMEGAHTAINTYDDGTLDYRSSGTITTLTLSGTADFSSDGRSKTITNAIQMYSGCTLNDPHGVVTYSAGFKTNHCRLDSVNVNTGIDRTYTVS